MINVRPIQRQLIFSKLGQFCYESNGSDLYHMATAVEILRSVTSDKPLQDHYNDKYNAVCRYLDKQNIIIQKFKAYYDRIKTFDDRLAEIKLKEIFSGEFRSILPVGNKLFRIFEILVDKTEIRLMPIQREYLQAAKSEKQILKVGENQDED